MCITWRADTMASILAAAFILCLLAAESLQSEEIAKTQKCATTRKMEVLPGRGWDNLRNKDMGQVLKLSYDKCKTTEDGVYLLPDHVSAIAIKESNLDLMSELIEHYTNYTSITSKSFKTEASGSFFGGIASVSGSFSMDYQNTKQHQVDDKSVTTRVHVRNTLYLLLIEPSAEIDPSLQSLIMDAAHELELKNTEKAQIIMEFIVRDYGTHFLTQVDAGAILAEEDFVTSKFVSDYYAQKNKVTAAAGASFLSKFKFGISYTESVDTKLTQTYKDSTTSSHVRAYGGSLLEPNLTVHDWSAQIVNNLVATDRGGEPLSFIMTPQKLTNISLQTLGKLRLLLDGAINDYYSFNTHVGCMSLDSPNFEYNANVDDHSCLAPYNNYTFGGVYQTCTLLENQAGDICGAFRQANPLTGGMSCPPGYNAIALHSGQKKSGFQQQECHESCSGHWFWKKCHQDCSMVYHESSAQYNSFWCGAPGSIGANTGFMFGGLYSSVTQNPLTRSQTCPTTYVPLLIGEELRVCVSNDYELGYRYSVPFGGFFSCSQGNILVHDDKASKKAYRRPNDPYPHSCPGGYSQHMAAIDYNCEINYCVKANAFGGHGQMPIVRPPFHDPASLYVKTSVPLTLTPALPESNSSLSGGSISGIVIGCIAVAISVVVGTVIALRRKRARNNAVTEDNDREPLISEGPQYGSVNDTVVPVSPEV